MQVIRTSLQYELASMRFTLDALDIGKKPRDLSMQLGEPYVMKEEESDLFIQYSKTLADLLFATEQLYRKSIREKDLQWLRDMFEGNLSVRAKELSRESIDIANPYPPVAFRPDFMNIHKLAEVQVQGSGLGLHHAIHQIFENRDILSCSPLSQTYSDAIKMYTRKDSPSVLFLAHEYGFREARLFSYVLESCHNIKAEVLSTAKIRRPIEPGRYDLIFWKGCLDSLLDNFAFQEILRKYKGSIKLHQIFAPRLSCLRLSKMNLVLPFTTETRHQYPDSVRNLIPYTRLISQEVATEVQALSRKNKRNLVVKYAGQDFSLNWGSKGVYMLGRSKKQDNEILQKALEEQNTSPWLLQQRISTKYAKKYVSKGGELYSADSLSARINPRYIQMSDGSLEFVGAIGMFSNDWKCHGSEDNIIAPLL